MEFGTYCMRLREQNALNGSISNKKVENADILTILLLRRLAYTAKCRGNDADCILYQVGR